MTQESDGVSFGRKVVLRHKRAADAVDDYRWRRDSELAELDAAVPLRMPFEEFQSRYEEELRYPTPWVRRFAVATHDGEHIGNCMAYDIDSVTGEGEAGIMIGERAYWGKGYGREAMAQLLAQCFLMPSINRIYLHTLEWNARARKAFAGVGFEEVRQVRRAGKNFILMEIRRPRWESTQAAAALGTNDAEESAPSS